MILGYIWVEIVFLKGLERFREIRKIADLMTLLVFQKSFSFFYPFFKPLQISFKFTFTPALTRAGKGGVPTMHMDVTSSFYTASLLRVLRFLR